MAPTLYIPYGKESHYIDLMKLAATSRHSLPSSSKQEIIDLLDTITDSSTALQRFHPIIPLIYRTIENLGLSEQLSTTIWDRLQQSYTDAIVTNLANQQWLNNILELITEKDIPVILLKAAAFHHSLYQQEFPRTGRDIDILVPQKLFDDACEVLSTELATFVVNNNRPVTHATLFERIFRPREGIGPTVELHRDLTNPGLFNIQENGLWERSLPHPKYGDERVRMLSPEDTLLHLAVHAFRDLDFCTHNLLDAHEVICQWNPDFSLLLQLAEEWGAKNTLHILLENCQTVMDSPIPAWLLKELMPSSIRIRLINSILSSRYLQNQTEKSMEYRFIQILSQLIIPDKIRQGLKFHLGYARIRMKDALASSPLNNRQ